MKDHARHVPGSIQSRCSTLSRSTALPRRFQASGKSTYKTQTKCRQNFKCDFFSYSPSNTYNFSAVTCLNSPGALSSLPIDNQSPATESHDARPGTRGKCYPFSLGEKVGMRGQTSSDSQSSGVGTSFAVYCTKRDKTGRIAILTKTDHAVSTTYDNNPFRRPIFREGPRAL